MKLKSAKKGAGLILAALTLGLSASTLWAADDIIVGPSGTQTGTSGSSPDFSWTHMWGNAYSNLTFDVATPPPTGDVQGSIYIQNNWTNTPTADDTYCVGSPSTWWGGATFIGVEYASIEMDFKYDTNSTISPASAAQVNIGLDTGYNAHSVTNLSLSGPIADGSWHHLSCIIDPSMPGVDAAHSVGFYTWNPVTTTGTMNYWVANVVLKARVTPLAPPNVSLSRAVPGLTQFADSSAFWNREDLCTDQSGNAQVTWYGLTKPVTYSWKIASFPSGNHPYFLCGLTLTPDPAASQNYADPDWSATNCLWVPMQNNPDGTVTAGIAWKTNAPSNNSMLTGSGVLVNYQNETTGLTVPSAIGTWTVTFTSDTGLTLTAPNGASTNVVLDASFAALFNGYVGAYLYTAPGTGSNQGQSATLSQFNITGVGTPVNEVLTSGALSSPYLILRSQGYWDNNANTYMTNPPNQIFITASDPYWFSWKLPATGFSPVSSPSLSSPVWSDISGTPLLIGPSYIEKISNAQLPGSKLGLFAMIQRTFTQLQVLLPGQTNAPGTISGYTGTATPISVAGQGLTTTTVTVNACDAQWHIVHGVTDQLHLTTSDGGAYLPPDVNMVDGTATFSDPNGILFQTPDPATTVTAHDNTNAGIPDATSAPFTVNN